MPFPDGFKCRSLLAGDTPCIPSAGVAHRLQSGSYIPNKPIQTLLLFLAGATSALAAPWVTEQPENRGAFPLVHESRAAAVIFSAEDFKVVEIAVHDFAADVERVTGVKPAVQSTVTNLNTPAVLVGTLGHSPLIDGLVATGKLDVKELRGAWESFVITTVANPMPDVSQALVIVGSDRRGTAFGVYELSQAIGVSPWYWWADVMPAKKSALFVAAGTRRFGPPSVQYRGIFLNDEDWGLQPWAAKTFEPEVGDIGPKTYAKVCELLLRLKANTLWPAMHACTKAFNLYPQNKLVADDYAIVMGSSHAEPMLRNNVTEWTAPHEQYDYVHNRAGVQKYWEDRVKENGRFENIYTLGMRGIHDSNMIGPKTDAERIATLQQIFADQREMLAKYARPKVGVGLSTDAVAGMETGDHLSQIPQMFCAYKEVLDLYKQGLQVPDDVTIVWPDDNFGYIRNFASPAERQRRGGFGVYYHISYLGAPMSYLWLETTPPALIWEEMSKAYEHGAQKIWIVNVGDLKPAEIGTEFFLQMAWDIKRWRHDNVAEFLAGWAAREFGADPGLTDPIADLLELYYGLNFLRKPEHLQWWLPGKTPQPSPFTRPEIEKRLAAFAWLRTQSERLAGTQPPGKRDAFEELVGYPIRAAALANERYFLGELGDATKARAADAELRETTRRFNEQVAGGKWRGLMNLEPADNQWKSFRIAPWTMPEFTKAADGKPPALTLEADQFVGNRASISGTGWEKITDLNAMAIIPTTTGPADLAQLEREGARLSYEVDFPTAGDFNLTAHLLPTHPLVPGRGLRFAVALDDASPQLIVCDVKDGSPEWAQGVLDNHVTVATKLSVPRAGKWLLRVFGVDAGVVLTKFVLEPAAK